MAKKPCYRLYPHVELCLRINTVFKESGVKNGKY